MSEWSVSDVSQWLESIHVPKEVVEMFVEEQMNGCAIADITSEDLKLGIPKLQFGHNRNIIRKRNDELDRQKRVNKSQQGKADSSPSNQGTFTTKRSDLVIEKRSSDDKRQLREQVSVNDDKRIQASDQRVIEVENCRMFECAGDVEKPYTRYDILPYKEGRVGDSLTTPHHLFVREDVSTSKGRFRFVRQTLQFVCACLNDRTNGTIHFGVASQLETDLKPGTVIGTRLNANNPELYVEFLKKAIAKCFAPEQLQIVLECVRNPAFLKVEDPDEDPDVHIYVVDVDVIPSYGSCRENAFFVQLPLSKKTKELADQAVFVWKGDSTSQIDGEELASFMNSKRAMADKRKDQEEKQRQSQSGTTEDQCKKLVRLLCHGEDDFVGEFYPILVINKPEKHMDESFLQETMTFLNKIQWKAVFDFDAEATVCKFFDSAEERSVEIIATTNDFDPRSEENVARPERLEELKESILSSNRCPWIFSNGHEETGNEQLDPVPWNKTKREGFRKAVDFFADTIPDGRAVIVHLLLSDEWQVMLEATQDFHSVFPEQCVCIAEKENILTPWNAKLCDRNSDEMDTLTSRSIVGLSWKQVNQTIGELRGPKRYGECRLPSSCGSYVTMKPKILQRLEDLDILGANQCENSEILEYADELDKLKIKSEEAFYKGGKVDWWNFYFTNQVLQRSMQKELDRAVHDELEGMNEGPVHVRKVRLFHQPGCGGTTTAMQTLWDFRKKYRCAVVRNISRHTADQILRLYRHDDLSPRPVLLLLDNVDEEKAANLTDELDAKSTRISRTYECTPGVTCVFLECVRRTQSTGKLMLKQELKQEEKRWFESTNERLKRNSCKDNRVDRKLLISFHIMRTNFDPGYIKETVKNVIDEIDSDKEKILLKYVALVNLFEVGFDPLPTAAFDLLMTDGFSYRQQGNRKHKHVPKRWETVLSHATRILINEVSDPKVGQITSLRMASPLLSEVVLAELRKQDDGTEQSLSDVVLEFFKTNYLFKHHYYCKVKLFSIVKNMLIKREGNGFFAPLIQTIVSNEGQDKASRVLEEGYELIGDAFVAQQVARFYIRCRNWKKAAEYAEKSTNQIPGNSFLWDTHGRIYLQHIREETESLTTENSKRPSNEIVQMIMTALDGIAIFRRGQQANNSEEDKCNDAVYLGELHITMELLQYLIKSGAFEDTEELRQFLVDGSSVPDYLSVLKNLNGVDYLARLRDTHMELQKAFVYLDDVKVQLSYTRTEGQMEKTNEDLEVLQRKYCYYFGEPASKVPTGTSDKERCQHRRRQLRRYRAFSLRNILGSDESRLREMKTIVECNIGNATYRNSMDLRIFISVIIALSVKCPHGESEEPYDNVSRYSRELYECRKESPMVYLEAYLFYAMFNWPRNNMACHVLPRVLQESLRQWKEAFFEKYSYVREAGRPIKKTTQFFLANGEGMQSIFYTEKSHTSKRGTNFWRSPGIVDKLQRFTGCLRSDGDRVDVRLEYDNGKGGIINIPTTYKICNRDMWNKTVYFVIGFSWDGPKAVDVDFENPADYVAGRTDGSKRQ